MGINPSVNRFPLDTLLWLRAEAQANITADTKLTAFDLGRLASYWSTDLACPPILYIHYEIEAAPDTTTGDETYTLQVIVDDNSSFSSQTNVGVSKVITAAGKGTLAVSKEQILAADANAAYLSLLVDVAGTTPIIALNAYVSTSPMPFA